MASTIFSPGTVISSAWLNDVNTAIYGPNSSVPGATVRTLVSKLSDTVSVKDFGAVGDNVTDDTVAIQNAINYAQNLGKSVYLPASKYLISGGLLFSRQIRFYGDGLRSVLSVSASVGNTVDIITVSSSVSDDTESGYLFENFRISPVSGTPGRHGIALNITTRPIYFSCIRGVRIDALGGRGIVTLPNASPLTDGFFTSVIEENTIYNGIYLDKAGDSIRISNNTLTGSNAGIYADLIFVSTINKPHGLEIVGNNITNSNGCVLIKSAWAARIKRNLFESPVGTPNNALVDIDGTDATNMPQGILIGDNFFATPINVDAIRVNFALKTEIKENMIDEPGGSGKSYRITANSVQTQISDNKTNLDSTMASQLSDLGSLTTWERAGLSGYHELNQDINLLGSNRTIRFPDSAGSVIRSLGLDSVNNAVVIGAQDALASNGHLLMFAGGTEVARLVPTTKQLLVNTTSPPVTTTAAFNGSIAIKDNDTAPAVTSGWAKIYVDVADGDLKVIFGDGTIKTIVTDT